ncbi:IclR family transcriptional regulator [Streptomyces sp. NPDC058417]|uniref:IclR family transcriptional regulator n=1 Tax=unclassified Streptomyces TaxID=2593676 RepID=UPI00366082C3
MAGFEPVASLDTEERHKESVVSRTTRLLEAFEATQESWGVSELAERVGLPKSTAQRLLTDLGRSGWVVRTGNRWTLGRPVFQVGNRVPDCAPNQLRETAMPHLARLHAMTGETVHLAVLDRHQVLYLAKVRAESGAAVVTSVGGTQSAHASALGKVLLAGADDEVVRELLGSVLPGFTPATIREPRRLRAELDSVRHGGWFAFDREEARRGLCCLARPVFQRSTRKVIGAMSVSVPAERFSPAALSGPLHEAATLTGARLQR